ncbi:MAG: hypothetical protein DHS20C21_13640 [Gemmatimonadota bacterium]|nr:MAG: hypothetical protein DHS20C21_13640 [Gemmatimonadota bacterium]
MPAYVILDVTVDDTAGYEEYKKLSGPALAASGGRFVVRGGACEVLEGDWTPERFVMLEFDSVAQAKAWYDSEQYRVARELRWKASRGRMILVDGIPSGGPL